MIEDFESPEIVLETLSSCDDNSGKLKKLATVLEKKITVKHTSLLTNREYPSAITQCYLECFKLINSFKSTKWIPVNALENFVVKYNSTPIVFERKSLTGDLIKYELYNQDQLVQEKNANTEENISKNCSINRTIDNLWLKGIISVRIRNALIAQGYNHLEDLFLFSFDELKKIPNMGRKSARELLQVIVNESMERTCEKIRNENIVRQNLSRISIDELSLSNRSRNALFNSNIKTLDQLVFLSTNEIQNLPNIGHTSLTEILEKREKIKEEIVEGKYNSISQNDELVKTVTIESLHLSNRSRNALESAGITNLKQLLDLSVYEIRRLPSIGRLSLEEILQAKKTTIDKIKNGSLNVVCTQKIPSYLLNKEVIICRFSPRLTKALISNGINTVRDILNHSVQEFLNLKNFGKKSLFELEEFFIKRNINLGENYIEDKDIQEKTESSFKELISEIKQVEIIFSETENFIYESRIKNKSPVSFRELAKKMNLSTERVRQIEKKIKQKFFTIFLEYKIVFDKIFKDYGMAVAYNLISEWQEFFLYTPILKSLSYRNSQFPYIINSEECVIYEKDFFDRLHWDSFIQGENQNLSFDSQKEILIQNLSKIVKSDSFCVENYTKIRNLLEKKLYNLWDQKYLYLENRRIPANRVEVLNLFLQKHCENTISLEEFINKFNIWLNTNDINVKYAYGREVLRNSIGKKDNVLWTTGFKLRYYPIESVNPKKFIDALDLNQYNNLDLSCKKIFLDYPELMKEYDIRDEYELHNFLRKQVIFFPKDLKVDFARMPTLRLGISDKKQQAMDIIHAQSPISMKDFVRTYSEKYGLLKGNIISNIVPLVSKYLTAGVFTDLTEDFPPSLFDFLSHSLTEDFYYIEDLKNLIKTQFSEDISNYLTAHNFKKLHFVYNSEYIYSERYSSANDYFRNFLSHMGILDLNKMENLKHLRSFLSTLASEINNLDYIEFSRNKYINITKLEQLNITKDDIQAYIKMVSKFVDDEFFTINYLRNKGFHFQKLEDLGFDDFFLCSILKTSGYFNVKSINSTYIFIKKDIPLKVEDFLEKIVGQYRKIDVYDLEHLLKEKYDIDFQKYELISFAKNSDLYYNPIMEKFYINYDEFFETV